MIARRAYLLAFASALALSLLTASSRAQEPEANTTSVLTPAEYRAEIERGLSAAEHLDSSGSDVPEELHDLPDSWRVHSDTREFEVSTEGIRRDVRRYEKDKTAENAVAIRRRLEGLRKDLEGFEKDPADNSAERTRLNKIMSRTEFADVKGPTWFDRLKQRLAEFVFDVLRHIFGSSAIPAISKYFVYALIAAALAALAFVVYRNLRQSGSVDSVVPHDLPVSAKEWTIWLFEARAAAAKGEWPDAIHLAYWAGISFLERQGTWKPDRARTPREYLRLLSSASEHRETLNALTRIFELAWYAKRDATESSFSQTLQQLEKLGCR